MYTFRIFESLWANHRH